MFVQAHYLLSPEAQEKLLTGEWVRHGGVMRNTSGQIMEHLVEVARSENLSEAMMRLTQLSNSRLVLTGSALVATAGAVAGGLYIHARARTDRIVDELNSAMTAYAAAVHDKRLSTEIIDQLSEALKATQQIRERSLKKLFESCGFLSFTDLLINYSRELAKANLSRPPEFDEPVDNNVVTIADYLDHQRKIISEAG